MCAFGVDSTMPFIIRFNPEMYPFKFVCRRQDTHNQCWRSSPLGITVIQNNCNVCVFLLVFVCVCVFYFYLHFDVVIFCCKRASECALVWHNNCVNFSFSLRHFSRCLSNCCLCSAVALIAREKNGANTKESRKLRYFGWRKVHPAPHRPVF